MSGVVPRALVAAALAVGPGDLPPGDLPLARLAARFLRFVSVEEPAPDHPDAWCLDLFVALTRDHPALGLAAILATLDACTAPEQVALLAAGPLEALIAQHGAAVIDEIEALAAQQPRFGYALSGVWRPEAVAPLVWARVEAARAGVAGLDDGAPLPPL